MRIITVTGKRMKSSDMDTVANSDIGLSRRRRTRIVATLGPASSTRAAIRTLFLAGVDVFRLNMSHGEAQDKLALVDAIRSVEREFGRPIAILVDLQGPKLRIGTLQDGPVTLLEGSMFSLDLDPTPGDTARAPLPHPEIFAALKTGTDLLLDDGKIRLTVQSCDDRSARCKVAVGGPLSDRKGVNVPGVVLPLAALTEKDRRDLDFMADREVDWFALSFVQRPEDIVEAKARLAGRAAIMAKIEKPAAVKALDGILAEADAVMVARGDLGVEEPLENVPGIQKHIVTEARLAGKPVVVATQMLESMITSPVPTRAEVSDVATAVRDGADAVMLSAESAMGAYAGEAVAVMDRVAYRVETDPSYMSTQERRTAIDTMTEDAISASAKAVAGSVGAATIVTFTTSGTTAVRASRHRPQTPVMALTPDIHVARKLALVWGLHTVKTKDVSSFEHMIAKAKRMALRHELASGGDRIVITAGVPFGTPGATNVLHIAWVCGDELDDYDESTEA